MIFREATLADIDQYMEVRMAARENVLINRNLVTRQHNIDYLLRDGKGWVCEVNGRIVGFAIVGLKQHNIWALFVHPDFEVSGIGRKLHDIMLGWYFEQTNETLWLSTSPGTRAETFYRLSGWEQSGMHGDEIRFEMFSERWRLIREKQRADLNKTTYDEIAEVYQEKFMDFDFYNDSYDRFCELVPRKSHIFEIGCGPGNVTRYLLSKCSGYKIDAIDIAPKMIELARSNNPLASFTIMDCRDINHLTKKYDAIFCGFCMPYLSSDDCAKLISDCAGLLHCGGYFYISMMEDKHDKSGYETGGSGHTVYIYYLEEHYVRELLAISGFEVVELLRKNYQKSDGSYWKDLIIISKKI
ncbi:MAG TPA: bifunctional N-acetyltransferase/class I SAM-dependent methyltransferase [Flavobacterium sp.]|jgi:predicted TPR repeat methyltransferase/GNAT superfamily N-acetyltransferase